MHQHRRFSLFRQNKRVSQVTKLQTLLSVNPVGYHHYSICSFIIPPHLRTGKKICVIRHAPGKGSCYVVVVAGEDLCVRAVDEAGLDEDGGHGSLAQDTEGGMGFYAAVFVACVKGGKAFYQLVLEVGRQSSARAVLFVAVGFCAPPAAGVDVDAEEDIGGPVVGLVYDARVAGDLAVEVMALQEFDRAAYGL